jgi:hypothetical protein
MRTMLAVMLGAFALAGCTKHRDENAEQERDEQRMMQKQGQGQRPPSWNAPSACEHAV